MGEFFTYFFGQGTETEFSCFSLAHFLPILFMLFVIFMIYRFRGHIRDSKYDNVIRWTMAFIMIVTDMSYYWRLVAMPSLGANPIEHLPITVCGWVIIFGSYMLVGKSQTLFDIVYFWVFTGTIFAVITPIVITHTGPTRFRYYQFWLEHIMGYIAIFYMIFVHKMRPKLKSAIKAYIALAVLAVIAYFSNQMLGPGANYLFMARPEKTPSILDILPSNYALRLFIMVVAITILFSLAYLPWILMDRRKKKMAAQKEQESQEVSV